MLQRCHEALSSCSRHIATRFLSFDPGSLIIIILCFLLFEQQPLEHSQLTCCGLKLLDVKRSKNLNYSDTSNLNGQKIEMLQIHQIYNIEYF